MQSVVGLLRSDLDRMLEVASLDTKAKKLSKQKYLEKGEKKKKCTEENTNTRVSNNNNNNNNNNQWVVDGRGKEGGRSSSSNTIQQHLQLNNSRMR